MLSSFHKLTVTHLDKARNKCYACTSVAWLSRSNLSYFFFNSIVTQNEYKNAIGKNLSKIITFHTADDDQLCGVIEEHEVQSSLKAVRAPLIILTETLRGFLVNSKFVMQLLKQAFQDFKQLLHY